MSMQPKPGTRLVYSTKTPTPADLLHKALDPTITKHVPSPAIVGIMHRIAGK